MNGEHEPTPAPRLFGVAQAAVALNISEKEVRRLHWKGVLNAVRIGTRVLFTSEELSRFIRSLEAKAAQERGVRV